MGLTGHVEIVGIMTLPAQQHRILAARHRLSDGEFLQRQPLGRGLVRQLFRLWAGRLVQIHGGNPAIPKVAVI